MEVIKKLQGLIKKQKDFSQQNIQHKIKIEKVKCDEIDIIKENIEESKKV